MTNHIWTNGQRIEGIGDFYGDFGTGTVVRMERDDFDVVVDFDSGHRVTLSAHLVAAL